MKQVARNLTMAGQGILDGCRYLLHDRDTKFCECLLEFQPAREEEIMYSSAVIAIRAVELFPKRPLESPGRPLTFRSSSRLQKRNNIFNFAGFQ
jgi:hypothetical protein